MIRPRRSALGLLFVLLAIAPLGVACARKADDAAQAAAAELDAIETKEAGPQRLVTRGAVIRLRADEPDVVVRRATEQVEGLGGYVATSSTDAVDDRAQQVQATLRVPADRLGEILAALRDEGELLHESRSGEDVTERHADLGAQLRSHRALEERLLALLEKASTVEDALRIETALTETRAEIERLDASVRGLDHDVAFATVELSVASPDQEDPASAETIGSQFERAIEDAGENLLGVLLGLVRALGVLLPLGFFAALFGLVGRAIWRAGTVRRPR